MTIEFHDEPGAVAATLSRMLVLLDVTPEENAAPRVATGADPLANPADLPGLVARSRPQLAPAFGLEPEERLVRVIAAAGFGAQEAASAMGLTLTEHAELSERAGASLSRGGAGRILILEDEWLSRTELERSCHEGGHAVVAATGDPELAVLAAAAYQPRLALIDLILDGDEVAGDLAAMRIRECAPGCELVFVTGVGTADRIAAVVPNARALVKPVGRRRLRSVIDEIFI